MGLPKVNLVLWSIIFFPLFILSCVSGPEDIRPSTSTVSSELIAESMGMMEELDLIVVSVLQQDLNQQKIFPLLDETSCPGAMITRETRSNIIIVDYGNGCVCNRGLEKRGKLTIKYTDGILIKGAKITLILESFYLNGMRMEGLREIENLGYLPSSRSLGFASRMENFQLTLSNGKQLRLTQDYIRELQFSTEETGFRIYLKGKEILEMPGFSKTNVEIIKSVVYRQECMTSGISAPSEGSLEIRSEQDIKVLVDFNSTACNKLWEEL
ncbi:MAG: hypothetical protein WD431_11165 [Cyclobacteriaceae bacterium]